MIKYNESKLPIVKACSYLYDCCNCGDYDCGCPYCFACNACENCLNHDEAGCDNIKFDNNK